MFKLGWVFLTFFIFFAKSNKYLSYEYIFEFNDDNFNEKIKSFEQALVIFYKNHEELLKFLKNEGENYNSSDENDLPVYLVYLDCTDVCKKVCNEYNIQENIEVKIFNEGVHKIDYKGPKSKNLAIKYLRNMNKPLYAELKTQKDIETFTLNQTNIFLLGYFTSDTNLKKTFLEVAKDLKHIYNFAIITKYDYRNHDKIYLQKPLHLQNKFEAGSILYQGKNEKKDLQEFIEKNKNGLVLLNVEYSTIVYPLTIIYFDVDLNNPQIMSYCRNRVLQVAYKFINKTNFAISQKKDFNKEVTYPYVILKTSENQMYEMNEKFNTENLERFLNYILNNNKLMKTQEIPEDNKEFLITLVAKNFREVIKKSTKNIFLILYNSNQYFDSDFFDIIENIAMSFEDEFLAAKMDVFKNQLFEPYEFYTNPTMYWVDKNKKPFLYTPEMFSSEEFLKFVDSKLSGITKTKNEL